MKLTSHILIYSLAALAEIAGCFAFWAWLRLDKSIWWLLPGIASLILFAALLTFIDAEAAGRAYAAYGGIYIIASLLWLKLAEDFSLTNGILQAAYWHLQERVLLYSDHAVNLNIMIP